MTLDWEGKRPWYWHAKMGDRLVELRKRFDGVNVLLVVYRDHLRMSMNGTAIINDMEGMLAAIKEAREALSG